MPLGEGLWSIRVGMTSHGLDELGDITSVNVVSRKSTVKSGQDLLELEWEGFIQTEADELYHTVWGSIEGKKIVKAPVGGSLVQIVNLSLEGEIDEDTVIAELSCNESDLKQACASWLDDEGYNALLAKEVPGRFGKETSRSR